MEEFDTRAWYKFTDKDGNTFSSLGDNGFVQQSIKEGVPISVNENGDWYVEPYLENKNGQVVAHLPEWFKSTNEYEQWKTYAAQIPSSLTDDTFNSLNDIFKGLSSQGLLRNSLKNDIASFGVTDTNLQNKYVNDIVQVAVEGKGGGAAKLNDIYGSDQNESAADVARSFKDMPKEELSSVMTNLYETMKKGQNGTFTGTQKQMLDAVTTARILNYVDDNYSTFGTDNEFQGLLEMSAGQKFQRGGTEFMQTMAEGPLGLFTARLVYLGTNGSMKIENAREEIFSRPLVGGGLEGGEGAQKIGSVAGSVGNIAVTMATSMLLGNAINAKLAVNSPSGFWGSVGNFAQTIPGGAVTDFFLHDVPVDLIFAADDLARTGSVEKAWYNPEEEQPLFGIPIIGSFGPRVPNGLAMNLAGDAIIDAAIPILAIAGNTAYKELDDITGGGVSRTKEKIAVKNLEIQNKLVEIPVLGTGWQKFMNYMMGAENAQYIREARKAAIAEGSMEPYVRAQNMLTLKNHAGGEVVAPMYKKLDDELKVTESAKNFLKNAEKYGGVGETRVEWKEIKNGVEQTLYKAVPDTLPRDVKQGLLDVERLSELKGEIENEGGVLFNPARKKEIAEIEKRLESTPQEIKDFADRFSELNKRVEAMGIDLDVTTEEWIAALQMDPRWDKYMVRQALVPGNPTVSGGSGPEPAIWNKSRKGYYADNYISPDLALNMKVEALGRAYAWNEQDKSLVAFEVSQGKVIAGKGGVDVANRLAQVKQEVKMGDAYRKSIDYDTVLNNFHKDTSVVNDAFRKVNDLQNLPNKITLKAVYDNQQSPRVKELVNDFNSGKIQFGEGVKEAVGVSDSQAAAIINNTFILKNGGDTVADNAIAKVSSEYNAGITTDGTPFKYTIEDGVITSLEQITDSKELSDVVRGLGGVYKTSPEFIEHIGPDFSHAINRTLDYYRNDIPPLPTGATFKGANQAGVYGWIPTPGALSNQGEYQFKIENGHIVAAEYPLYLESNSFAKGNEAKLLNERRIQAASGAKPKNSQSLEATPIHENGHNTMARLTILELNRKIDEGLLSVEGLDVAELNKTIKDQWENLHELLAKNALESMGLQFSEAEWKRQALTISGYAGSGSYANKTYHYETFSEAALDYYANGANASKFSIAIVEQMKKMSERFGVAADPGVVFAKNGLEAKGLFKDNQYNFPKNVKTDNQKAKWLDGWRQDNPYLYSEPTFTNGNEYAKNVTPENRKNIEGYKQFAEEHLSRVDDSSMPKDVEDFVLHIIRPGGDVDAYNSFLRDGSYASKEDWARNYIDDIPETYADSLEDIAQQFFPNDLEELNKELGPALNKMDYYESQIEYDKALSKMLTEKLLQGTEGNYKFDDNVILYRGVSTGGNRVNIGGDFSWLKEDGKFDDNGFGFVSLSDAAAKKYALDGSGDKYVLEYHIPAGQQAFYFGEIGRGGNDGGAFVLPAGVHGRVGKITNFGDGVKKVEIYLDGELVRNTKGLFTEDSYQKANLWDTYFQKEIRAYNPNSKSTMPDLLAKKNGDFLEDLSANAAKRMVQQIKEASVEGFDENLATMVLSRNSKDVVEAMDNFIIGRVNQSADEIAAKMPGGKTPENVNKARATVWSEDSIRNDIINTVATLSPDIDMGNIQSKVNNLFKTQAEGYASFEALPVETKKAVIEVENLSAKLAKENNYAKKIGKEVDSKARQEYLGEVTQVISYKQNGEDVYVVVSDPVVASVLKNPNNYKETSMTVETLAQMSNFLSRTYRIGTTGASPLAFVRNVLRDPMQAAIQGGFNPLTMNLSPQVFYRTLRGYGLDDMTIENVTRRLADWSGSSTLTAEMRKMGAISPNSISYNSRAGKINRVLDKATSNKIIEAAEAPLESWESFFRNQIAQQSFAKNYQRTKNVDKAMAAAMFDASNSTTNFSHSVGLFKRATSTVPYLSSAINGTRSFWTQFNVDPIGMITRVTAGFMVPAMAITAWNLSSEERRKEYMNLPEWYRDSHLVLLDLEGNIISFPIPDELGQYYGTARRLIEYTQEATPYGISSIMAQGVFGFLPVDVDGFFGEDNTIHWQEGISQAGSTLMPQAATAIYEFIAEKDLYTGQDLSTYDGLNKTINTLSNIFGTGIKNAANDIGMMMGVPEKMLVGKSTADTLARDLFGVGFDNAKTQFMSLVGSPSTIDANGKETKATGLFAENEKLKKQIEAKDKEIAYASADRVKELEEEKRNLIKNFTDKVVNLTNKYMSLYTQTGGLEEWQKERLVRLLTLGEAYSSADSTSYQYADISEASLDERSLAQQRYVDAGLPAGPSLASLGQRDTGTFINSIETQAAINRFYGAPKQASTDFDRAVKNAGLKNIRDDFYDAVSKVYDIAEANNETPDYDMIEKIQARYLQAVDSALIPIINQYGISILNNSNFIDTVEKYVNGMIPSDDWKQSTKNAKKYLSTKEFPTATVNVKKWLIQRYSSGMKDRGLASDSEVTDTLNAIKVDIDAGRRGAARGKIESLMKGINRANYYISSNDFQTLSNYYNMVK